jgi:hypothetical protein
MRAFRRLPRDHVLNRDLKITAKGIVLRDKGVRALPLVIDLLSQGEFEEVRHDFITCVLHGCTKRKLPTPNVGIGLGESDYSSESKQ